MHVIYAWTPEPWQFLRGLVRNRVIGWVKTVQIWLLAFRVSVVNARLIIGQISHHNHAPGLIL